MEQERGIAGGAASSGERGAAEAELRSFLDLDRYPLDRPGSSAYRALLAEAQAGLAAQGAIVFEGFLRDSAVARTLAQADPLRYSAFVCGQPHNVYLKDPNSAFPPAHARNRQVRSEKAILADDEIPAGSPLRAIYEWDRFRAFVCDALEIGEVFAFDDPLASVNINFYGAGQELGWHFDNSKFTVTIMLREAETGGAFEFAPNIRDDSEAGHAAVDRILDGDRAAVAELKQGPGALVLFKGSRSLHRVTPSRGPLPRTIAILSYTSEPGRGLNEHTRLLFYGRTG
ncbi:MAG TPA: 2OG-Fe(II) oxygenase [Dongiaceae bacterium]